MSVGKLILIRGLPGSGKTYLGEEMSVDTGMPFYDDCLQDLSVWDQIVADLDAGKSVIAADPRFCDPLTMDRLKDLTEGHHIEYISFENSPEVCYANCERRDFTQLVNRSWLRYLSEQYIPIGKIVPCFRLVEKK